ncbi:MAG: type II toxin-antitoxin system HicB family antitoxin [Methanosarcinales archaeon Met12]|nr:MAG: type II toxin-antitoxin system HicB family antitoxin [Methanosarcinales archaeon Met12]
MGSHKYTIEIFYSEEDGGHIAIAPELPGCSAFGETEEEALKEIRVAIDLWLETAKKENREIPKSMGKEFLKSIVDKVSQGLPSN